MEERFFSVNEAMDAIQNAQKLVEEAQANPNTYTEAQNQLNYAEQIIMNAQIERGNLEDKHELQRATDLLRMLQETQQSIRYH